MPTTTELLTTAMLWINAQTGLAVPPELPTVQFSTQCEMAARIEVPSCDYMRIMGVHQDNHIYLYEDWSPDDPVDVSILVHELVHYMQWNAGHRDCLEFLAYTIQGLFLESHGLTFQTLNLTPTDVQHKMECKP